MFGVQGWISSHAAAVAGWLVPQSPSQAGSGLFFVLVLVLILDNSQAVSIIPFGHGLDYVAKFVDGDDGLGDLQLPRLDGCFAISFRLTLGLFFLFLFQFLAALLG
jgi:hypothetical protein